VKDDDDDDDENDDDDDDDDDTEARLLTVSSETEASLRSSSFAPARLFIHDPFRSFVPWSVSSKFSSQNFARILHLPHALCKSHISQMPDLDQPVNK